VLIILLAAQRVQPTPSRYGMLLLAGLVCSLAGDVFLMLPEDRFIPGLASFLAAQICYAIAFWSDARPSASVWRFLPYLLYALAL